MININRIYATLLLIRYTIIPPITIKEERRWLPDDNGTVIRIAPATFPILDHLLRPDGKLELLFEDALAPAAPFLLYHLKRKGFSECKAVVVQEGILLTGRR